VARAIRGSDPRNNASMAASDLWDHVDPRRPAQHALPARVIHRSRSHDQELWRAASSTFMDGRGDVAMLKKLDN